MRIVLSLAIAALPLILTAQEQTPEKQDPAKASLRITGCVKGSTLTETNLRIASGGDEEPARRWRLRASKELMKRLKQHAGKELEIEGTTKGPDSAMVGGGTRLGKTNIYVGPGRMGSARDPLPDLPTIDVERFEPTGEQCR